MKRTAIGAAALGATMIVIGIGNHNDNAVLTFSSDQTFFISIANILVVYFVLALLIERACEVGVSVLTATNVIRAGDGVEGSEIDRERKLVSTILCFGFSIGVALLGVRLIEMVLIVAIEDPTDANRAAVLAQIASFPVADSILTALILSGGSDQIHSIIKRLNSQ